MMDKQRSVFRGEILLCIAVILNSFGVVLMLHSNGGISAISSVPYAFSEVFPILSLGTWNYIFQGLLVLSLMVLRKKFVLEYLLSFLVGFVFGKLLDVHEAWVSKLLPQTLPLCILYFLISYFILCFGVALCNRCKLPIAPTDLFPREVSQIKHIAYSKVKIPFDVLCLATTAALTFFFLGEIRGLGIGTVVAAFTMGKTIGIIGKWMDRHFVCVSFLHPTLEN
jgi:uncharacterized membrane protein YczE